MSPKEILPVSRSRKAAQKAYDRMSRWYDLMTGISERSYRKAGLGMLNPGAGEKILEIGCGTGLSAIKIAGEVGDDGSYFAFDISPLMLEVTKKRLAKYGLLGHSEIVQGDAYELPFPDRKFDAVYMCFVLELFDTPDIPVVLGHCKRVLKPGSRLVVVAMSKGKKQGAVLKLYEWLHKRFPNTVDCRPICVVESLINAGFNIVNMKMMSLAGIDISIVSALTQKA